MAKNINDANPGAKPLIISTNDVVSRVIAENIVEIVATKTETKDMKNAVLLLMSISNGPISK